MESKQEKTESFIEKYKGATKTELKANLKRLKSKGVKSGSVKAEMKAIEALLN